MADLTTGADVVVIGSVRRRFFNAGGATQSRTEVVADKVVPARRRRDVERAVGAACRALLAPADVDGGGGRREDRMSGVVGVVWRQSSRTTKPVRSFGVKNVDFGGISTPFAGGALDLGDARPAGSAPRRSPRRRRRRRATSSRPCW